MLIIPDELMARIREIAEMAYPREGCGFLLGHEGEERKVEKIVEAPNLRAPESTDRYLISSDLVRAVQQEARRTGQDILGFFHSHPDSPCRPSEFDRDHAWPWYSYLIVSVIAGAAAETACWRLAEDRTAFVPERVKGALLDPNSSALPLQENN